MTDRIPSGGKILLFNKPFGVLTRFTDQAGRANLSDHIDVPSVYPVGRLDADSEGLLVLTDRASLVQPLLVPGRKDKRYLVCVEGEIDDVAVARLSQGVNLKDGLTLPAQAKGVNEPPWLWRREPPVRFRKSVPTSWLELTIREGKNRQVRRMTAAVGFPTLRLIRIEFGPLRLDGLACGAWRHATEQERRQLWKIESEFQQQRRPGSSDKPHSGRRRRKNPRSTRD